MANLHDMTIVSYRLTDTYTIALTFKDGTTQAINFEPVIGYGWMKELIDPAYFSAVKLNEGGNLEWPNGQDFNPEALYDWQHFEPLYRQEAMEYLKQA